MGGTETNGRCSAVNVVPPVVVVGDAKLAAILASVAIAVPDKRSFPLLESVHSHSMSVKPS